MCFNYFHSLTLVHHPGFTGGIRASGVKPLEIIHLRVIVAHTDNHPSLPSFSSGSTFLEPRAFVSCTSSAFADSFEKH